MLGLVRIQAVWHWWLCSKPLTMDDIMEVDKDFVLGKSSFFWLISNFVTFWLPLQTVWTQIRLNILSGLIWIQIVWHQRLYCKPLTIGDITEFDKDFVPGKSFFCLYRLLLPVDYQNKQFGPRSGPTKCWAWSGSKLFGWCGKPLVIGW